MFSGTVRIGHGITVWFKIGERVCQGEISITSDMQMTPPICQKVKTKEPRDESERGE